MIARHRNQTDCFDCGTAAQQLAIRAQVPSAMHWYGSHALCTLQRHGQYLETRANLLDFVFLTVLVVRAEQAASCTDMQLIG